MTRCGLKEAGRGSVRAKRSQFGAGSYETNPIWTRRGRVAGVNVQNKAKLGWTGVCRKRASSSVARPGSETYKTNQIWPVGHGEGDKKRLTASLQAGAVVRNEAKLGATRVDRQRRLSRGPWFGSETCETKPISPERPGMGAGRRVAMSRRRRLRKTKPILATGRGSRAGTPNPFDYRSGQALRRAETCETKPIPGDARPGLWPTRGGNRGAKML
jgi:hypothetical protein